MNHPIFDEVQAAAMGRWLDVLGALAPGLAPAIQRLRRHVPCPIHGGKDGFRLFKDAPETGGGVCNTCGAFPNGFKLLMWLNHWDFKQCLHAVSDYLGLGSAYRPVYRPVFSLPDSGPVVPCSTAEPSPGLVPSAPTPGAAAVMREMPAVRLIPYQAETPKIADTHCHTRIAQIWAECLPVTSASAAPLHRYLANRQLRLPMVVWSRLDDALRFHPELSYFDEEGQEAGRFPALIAAIRSVSGELITLHRTYLGRNGQKAKVNNPRKMMSVPAGARVTGAAISIAQPMHGLLGVAEGLETALSAFQATRIPVWSTVSATLMASVEIPTEVHTLLIWADKDRSLTGERAAWKLKRRLEGQGFRVFVLLPLDGLPPKAKSLDWNDVLQTQGRWGFPSLRLLRTAVEQASGDYRCGVSV